MKIEDLKTEKIIKLFGLQSGCMSKEELREIIKINKDHNNEYILEMEHGLIDSRILMILLRSGYTMEIYNDQKEYFDTKCKVARNVYTDYEGVTYNSLIEEE